MTNNNKFLLGMLIGFSPAIAGIVIMLSFCGLHTILLFTIVLIPAIVGSWLMATATPTIPINKGLQELNTHDKQ